MDCINGAVLKSIEDVGGRDWCLCSTAVTGNPPGFGLLQCTMYMCFVLGRGGSPIGSYVSEPLLKH